MRRLSTLWSACRVTAWGTTSSFSGLDFNDAVGIARPAEAGPIARIHALFLSVATFALLAGGARTASAGNIVYSLVDYPAFENGYALSGTITTDGKTGELSFKDILAWQVTITPPVGAPFNFDSTMAQTFVLVTGVTASVNVITLPDPPFAPLQDNLLALAGPPGGGGLTYLKREVGGREFIATAPQEVWNATPGSSDLGVNPWVIATVRSPDSSIPEPSTLVLSSILLGLFGMVELRKALKKATRNDSQIDLAS